MSSLGDKARLAVVWNTGFNLFRDLLQFCVTLVLVRILSPRAYGEFGLVTTVVGFIYVFSFRSFLAHTLQVQRDEDVDYQVHFTAGAVLHTGLFLLTNAAAAVMRRSATYAPISLLLHIMSVGLLLDWVADVRIKMLQREMDWRRMRLLHAAGLVGNAVLALAMALAGAGVYALLVPSLLVRFPFIIDLLLVQRWRPAWTWSVERFADAWRFGVTRLLSAMVVAGRQLIEGSLLVQLVGYASFGFFGRAVGLAQMFLSKFALLLMEAIYPALTRVEGGPQARARRAGIVLQGVSWVVIPLAVTVAVLADPVIRVVYGPKWLEVIPLLPWAMAAGAAGSIAYAAYMLLLSNDRQRRCLLDDIVVFLGTGASLVWLVPLGLRPYFMGLAATQLASLVLLLVWLRSDGAIRWGNVVTAIGQPSIAIGCALLVCDALRGWARIEVGNFWPAAVYGSSLMALYVGFLRLFFSARLVEILSYAPARRRLERLLLLEHS